MSALKQTSAEPPLPASGVLRAEASSPGTSELPSGLSAAEARRRRQTGGPNSMPDTTESTWRRGQLVAYAGFIHMPLAELVPLVLTAVLASIPVALPATFTLASALGARALAKLGVLPTRLSAVDEAATMDVPCADKTGTLTRNELKVTTVQALLDFDDAHVLTLAALASSDGGQDPVDAAIRAAAGAKPVTDAPQLVKFVPFEEVSSEPVAPGIIAGRPAHRLDAGVRRPGDDAPVHRDRGRHVGRSGRLRARHGRDQGCAFRPAQDRLRVRATRRPGAHCRQCAVQHRLRTAFGPWSFLPASRRDECKFS
jgi:hypothetical protein